MHKTKLDTEQESTCIKPNWVLEQESTRMKPNWVHIKRAPASNQIGRFFFFRFQ
jgi:hypothetical protein